MKKLIILLMLIFMCGVSYAGTCPYLAPFCPTVNGSVTINNGQFTVIQEGGSSLDVPLLVYRYVDTSQTTSGLILHKGKGTIANPEAQADGDEVHGVYGASYDGDGWDYINRWVSIVDSVSQSYTVDTNTGTAGATFVINEINDGGTITARTGTEGTDWDQLGTAALTAADICSWIDSLTNLNCSTSATTTETITVDAGFGIDSIVIIQPQGQIVILI